MNISLEINLGVIDKITQGAIDSEEAFVSLVATSSGDVAVVGDITEPGVASFIATLDKEVLLDYWGDSPVVQWLVPPVTSTATVAVDGETYIVSRTRVDSVESSFKVRKVGGAVKFRKEFTAQGHLDNESVVQMAKELANG